MIVTYLDSSALMRLCLGEGELAPVEAAMAELPITSVLTEVEVPAAIHARRHRGAASAEEEARLLELAGTLVTRIGVIGLSPSVRKEAVRAASRTLVRSLDAIHVGTAAVAARQQRRRGNTVRFCTADRRQAAAAGAALGEPAVVLLPELERAG